MSTISNGSGPPDSISFESFSQKVNNFSFLDSFSLEKREKLLADCIDIMNTSGDSTY
jgi:hypothetical protein